MRARNIKPALFANELLAECAIDTRLLFIGLWCIADREGRLEDRPARIKAQLYPYDQVNVDDALEQLADRGFIVRYEVEGQSLIQVEGFARHQNPHHREADSKLPPAPSLGKGEAKPRAVLGKAHGAPGKVLKASAHGGAKAGKASAPASKGKGGAKGQNRSVAPEKPQAQGSPRDRPRKALLIPDSGFLIPEEKEGKEEQGKAPQKAAGAPQKPDQPGVASSDPMPAIPCEKGTWAPTAEMVEEWRKTFPHLDVVAQIRMARQWCIDNPARRKTQRGCRSFIFKWLSNSDKAPSPQQAKQQGKGLKQGHHVLLAGE